MTNCNPPAIIFCTNLHFCVLPRPSYTYYFYIYIYSLSLFIFSIPCVILLFRLRIFYYYFLFSSSALYSITSTSSSFIRVSACSQPNTSFGSFYLLLSAVADWVRMPTLGSDELRRGVSDLQCSFVASRTTSNFKSQAQTLWRPLT